MDAAARPPAPPLTQRTTHEQNRAGIGQGGRSHVDPR